MSNTSNDKVGEGYEQRGYRIVSRKYGIISRLDRPDWKEYCLKKFPNWKNMPDVEIADWYRRCVSKDTLEIGSRAIRLKIPNSGDKL